VCRRDPFAPPHQQEDRKVNNQKIDYGVHQDAVVDRRSAGGLGGGQRVKVPMREIACHFGVLQGKVSKRFCISFCNGIHR
jgi:hypothetical protein